MITKENASELSKLANQVRWEKWRKDRDEKGEIEKLLDLVKLAQVPQAPVPAVVQAPVEIPIESVSDGAAMRLARVQDQLIERMTDNDDPKAVSALAQALKNVREVYHLVTGQAKPGTLQPGRETRRSRQPVQSTPEPDILPIVVSPVPDLPANDNVS